MRGSGGEAPPSDPAVERWFGFCDRLGERMEHRRLTTFSAATLVVANMVGAGVFTTSGYALADHERGVVLLAWLVGGVLAICGCLAYGALGRRFPHSGGEYELLRRTIHPLAGFLAGWVSLLAGFTAPIAFAAAAFGRYLGPVLGIDAGPWLGTFAILVAGGLHLRGARLGARSQDVVVVLKVVLIVAFLVFGAAQLLGGSSTETVPLPPARPFDLAAFAVTCVWVSFAYSGWNAASYVAGEIDDAERSLPRALLLGTLVTAALYLGLNAVFVYAAPVEVLAGKAEIGLLAADALGGAWLERAVAGVVALALFTSIAAMMMAGPRVYARMAADGFLPRVLASGADHRPAILLQITLALVALWTQSLDSLMTYIGWTLSVSSAMTVCGLIRVRLRKGADAVPVPGWPVVPAFYVLVTLAIAAFSFSDRPTEASAGLGTLCLGALAFAVAVRRGASVAR
jgi:amino acid transporter